MLLPPVGPVFAKHADSLIQQSQPSDARTTPNGEDLRAVDLFQHARKSIAEALVIAIFGEVSRLPYLSCTRSLLFIGQTSNQNTCC